MARRNTNFNKAKEAKNDEFYTLYEDIQKEVNAYLEYDPDLFKNKTVFLPCDDPEWSNFTKFFAQNFENFGLKKLISTSYAVDSKNYKDNYQPTLFELDDPKFDNKKTRRNGKIFILDKDIDNSGTININDLQWNYLEGDGDFRSNEVKKIRDEADFIVTNPPFSLFTEFLPWIIEANKSFLVISNINSITLKSVFNLIKDNKVWLGTGMGRWISGFIVPESYELYGTEARVDEKGNRIVSTNDCMWLTNIDHGRRHQPLQLMSLQDNLKFSKHKKIREIGYQKYDDYDALNIPFTDSIPSDYDGLMGVPISFLGKYNPDQFEILGLDDHRIDWRGKGPNIDGKTIYRRIIIRRK
jgi:hypothetical protein